ncbi:hypothetical protein [Terrihabitans sp. B22-R8]|uniref:hypothetical protein n=1 Tax=Terrihabitans sp. B22-R8 TaxID=3425128 RepID=UPI00403C0811
MREDDLLPFGLRLMTNEGLRFIATYNGLLSLADKQAKRGGNCTARWLLVARKVRAALAEGEHTEIEQAVTAFSDAAYAEGWTVRGGPDVIRKPTMDPRRPSQSTNRIAWR